MTVRVEWETGQGSSAGFPGFADRAKYKAWIADIDAQKRQHSQTVPLPDYNGQDVCGITVHFLPCDDVKVTTSCWSPRNANYPDKRARQDEGARRMSEVARLRFPGVTSPSLHYPHPTGRVR